MIPEHPARGPGSVTTVAVLTVGSNPCSLAEAGDGRVRASDHARDTEVWQRRVQRQSIPDQLLLLGTGKAEG